MDVDARAARTEKEADKAPPRPAPPPAAKMLHGDEAHLPTAGMTLGTTLDPEWAGCWAKETVLQALIKNTKVMEKVQEAWDGDGAELLK